MTESQPQSQAETQEEVHAISTEAAIQDVVASSSPPGTAKVEETSVETTGCSFSLFTWLLFALFGLLAIACLVFVTVLALKALDRPRSATAGTLMYATTFDGSADEWYQVDGQMTSRVRDGALHLTVDAASNGVYSPLSYEFSDFDVRINAQRLIAVDEFNEIGLLFRYRDNANYYMLAIRGDGAYSVERHKDGQIQVLSQYHTSPAVLPGLNVVNQLQVIAQGDHFKFYVNGQPLLLCPSGPGTQKSTWNGDDCLSNNGQTATELVDETFSTGKIGPGVRVSTPGLDVAFDNVVIYAP